MTAQTRYGFENLKVYRLAEEISDYVWDVVKGWRTLAADTVGKQLIRAIDRVGADLAEGTGRSTPKDNRKFVDDARGSFYETRHWLRRAYKRKLLTSEQIKWLRNRMDALGPMLNAYRNALKRRTSASSEPPTSNL